MLLLNVGIEAANRPQPPVVFEAERGLLDGLYAGFDIRREDESIANAGAMQGASKGRIESNVEAANIFVHYGADFNAPSVRRMAGPLVSYFA